MKGGLFTWSRTHLLLLLMGFAFRVRSAGQKYGPTCHQRDRADVTEFVTLVRLSSLGQHVGVLALAGYKRRKSALAANPIVGVDPEDCEVPSSRVAGAAKRISTWPTGLNPDIPKHNESLFLTRDVHWHAGQPTFATPVLSL